MARFERRQTICQTDIRSTTHLREMQSGSCLGSLNADCCDGAPAQSTRGRMDRKRAVSMADVERPHRVRG
ncbi:hypothetical protein [Nonomuraea sp. WAC 01424]|uniref:hypothetical protein n=1 Tax=Nonomuraea sp. WAC 01424 TaxID=2203200 RepID=UPI00163BFEC8|nr:hypothetical protein [Nonomuraea sp. WAC 01424]